MKRYASHFLYLSSNKCLKQYAVELKDGCVFHIFPLVEETESTLWIGGTIILSTSESAIGHVEIDADGNVLSDLPVYAYQLINGVTLKRLE